MKEFTSNLKIISLASLLLLLTTTICGRLVHKDNINYDYGANRYYSNQAYDFSQIKNVKNRKKFFIDFMSLIIQSENRDILDSRIKLIELSEKKILTIKELTFINNIEKVYLLKVSEKREDINWKKILNRVDIIPLELALTQSAIESGWGTSVISRKGNNMFGHVTYKVGTGIAGPSQSYDGRAYEMAIFSSVNDSVKKYMLNLNTNNAYKKLRNIRKNLRDSNSEVHGESLSSGLMNYSEVGIKYEKMINLIIRDITKYWRVND